MSMKVEKSKNFVVAKVESDPAVVTLTKGDDVITATAFTVNSKDATYGFRMTFDGKTINRADSPATEPNVYINLSGVDKDDRKTVEALVAADLDALSGGKIQTMFVGSEEIK
jgi:hypothetical protein